MSFTPPLWSLTAAQLADYTVLTSMDGTIVRPGTDPNNALYVWRADVDRALALKLPVGDEVLMSRQRNAHPIKSPAILQNAKGRPFTWSFTSLDDFLGCPKRYAHRRFYCDVIEEETEALRDGNRVHKAAEQMLKGEPVSEPHQLPRLQPFLNLFLEARSKGALVEAEVEVVLSEQMQPVSWFAKDAWFRGKLDVLVTSGTTCAYYDWKTGSVKDNYDQLKICCAALSIVRPEIEVFAPKFIWLKAPLPKDRPQGCDPIKRADIPAIWEDTLGKVERMKKAWASENFPAKPSGLCRWKTGQCPAYSICQYRKG